MLMKNQIIIFFLLPILVGLLHSQIKTNKKFLIYAVVLLNIFVVSKYHLRFNVDRKFHELKNIDISQNINAGSLNKKLNNLKWVTPGTKNKKHLVDEIKYLKDMENLFKIDESNKIIYTHYSFFSVILDKNANSPSRWFPKDGSGFPLKGNKFLNKYATFLSN